MKMALLMIISHKWPEKKKGKYIARKRREPFR